jgi:hypothetical protein
MLFKKIFLPLLIIFVFSGNVLAQPTPGGPGKGENAVPITGIEYLLLSGGALGVYRLYKRKVQK